MVTIGRMNCQQLWILFPRSSAPHLCLPFPVFAFYFPVPACHQLTFTPLMFETSETVWQLWGANV